MLIAMIFRLTGKEKFRRDFGLKDQIQRASVSVMSNIAEGYERMSKKEFVAFLGYAKGSVGELRSQLYVALDLGYISEEEHKAAYELAISIVTQLSNFMKYLKAKQ